MCSSSLSNINKYIISFQDQLALGGRWVFQGQKGTRELQDSWLQMGRHLVNLENLGSQDLKDSKESQGLQVPQNQFLLISNFLKQTFLELWHSDGKL